MNKLQRKQLDQHINNLRWADNRLLQNWKTDNKAEAEKEMFSCYYELKAFLDSITETGSYE